MTVLLARSRQPPPAVTAGVPHAELAAELVTLPSGLLAMVCEAIVKRKVRLGAAWACVRACVCACGRVCVRACRLQGPSERAYKFPRRVHGACQSRVGATRASTDGPTYAEQ